MFKVEDRGGIGPAYLVTPANLTLGTKLVLVQIKGENCINNDRNLYVALCSINTIEIVEYYIHVVAHYSLKEKPIIICGLREGGIITILMALLVI